MNSLNDIRDTLAASWLIALERAADERVPDEENFFELGGGSMQLIRLHMLIEQRLGLHIEVADVFDVLAAGNFGDLTAMITECAATGSASR